MRFLPTLRLAAVGFAIAAGLAAQAPPIIFQAPPAEPAKPQPAQPQQPGTNPAAAAPKPQTVPAAQPRLSGDRPFLLGGVSLSEMIDVLAKEMKINYILDPRLKGSVTIYTYGEVKPVDLMPLMETILRVNGAAMVKVGDLYRIVPINTVSNLPMDPMTNADPKTLPDDERMVLNMVFLKFATAAELDKLLTPFLGEGASHSIYEPANLMIIQDNSRNMKRTMELISLFDSDTFAGQRVRLFDVTNSRPSDLVKELDSVFKAYALSEKNSAVKFIAVDRINTVIGVAPNPGIFVEVQKWIDKLDVAVKSAAGAVNNYVYRMRYGRAETIAMAVMALYSGNPMALASMAMMMNGGGMGGYGMGGMGAMGAMGGFGGMGGMGGMGYGGGGFGAGGYGAGGYGMGGYGAGGYGMGGYGAGGYGGYGGGMYANNLPAPINVAVGATATPQTVSGAGTDQTGAYMGLAAVSQGQGNSRIPHVIPNPFDNTLLVQGTPQEWEQISSLLRQLDVPPRQVLIDAKIYEVELTGAFSAGVTAYLEKQNTGTFSRTLNAVSSGVTSSGGGLALSAGLLVLRSHELLGALSAAETTSHTRVISAPSIIATDSVPAVMNVGQDVPVLTGGVAGGLQSGGSTAVYNTVSSRSTGVTLSIISRINSSGVVTMMIDQDVSQPQANSSSNIDSPSFSRRSFQTQVTVQDGDTVAIGGFIGEQRIESSSGVPFLHRLPLVGAAFGSKSYSKNRSELIIFLTPRVIYDTNQIQDATDEIKGNLKRIQKMSREQ